MARNEKYAKALAATRRSRGTSGVKTYEDEAGGSYKAGHPQRIARSSVNAQADEKHTKIATKMLQRRDPGNKPIGKQGFASLLKQMMG